MTFTRLKINGIIFISNFEVNLSIIKKFFGTSYIFKGHVGIYFINTKRPCVNINKEFKITYQRWCLNPRQQVPPDYLNRFLCTSTAGIPTTRQFYKPGFWGSIFALPGFRVVYMAPVIYIYNLDYKSIILLIHIFKKYNLNYYTI